MDDKDWVKAATADDSLVVELLLRLNHSSPSPPPLPPLSLEWTVRQPRSKSVTLNKPVIARASPNTPLSWSGGTSHSGGPAVDGFEESSRPATGSKVTGTSEAVPTKRSRKRKTLTELKEDEILLLKERMDLKKNIATLLVTLEEKRVTNVSLKRMKTDLIMQEATKTVANFAFKDTIPDQTPEKLAASDRVQKEVNVHELKFVVPDLNVAFEEMSEK